MSKSELQRHLGAGRNSEPSAPTLLGAIFEAAEEAMVIADDDGRYVDANPAACALFGLSREHLVGRSIGEFSGPAEGFEARWRAFLQAGRVYGETVLRRADGTRRDVEGNGVANVLPGLHLSILRDVTARKATERALRDAEQRLLTVISGAPLILFAVDKDGVYTLYQGKGIEALGLRPGELVGQSVFTATAPAPSDEGIRRALAGEELNWPCEVAGRTFDCRLVPARDAAGAVVGVTGVALDITERKRAAEDLRASEGRYRRLMENTSEGVWIIDAAAVTTFVNERMAQMLGCTVHEALGVPIEAYLDEATRNDTQARLSRRKQGEGGRRELRLIRRDGSELWVSLHADPIFDVAGRYEGSFALLTDITERRRADEARNRLAALVESSDDAIIGLSLEGAVTSWNRGATALYGFSAEEMLGESVYPLVPEDRRREQNDHLARVRSGESVRNYETVRLHKNGTPLDVSLTVSAIRDASGAIVGISKSARDITERKRGDRVRNLLAALVESSEDAIISRGTDGCIQTWNRAAEKLTGYTAAEAVGQHISMLYPPEDRERLNADREMVDRGRHLSNFEMTALRKDGSRVEVSVAASIVRDSAGAVQGVSVIVRDISERRRAEAALRRSEDQLRQSQKMDAIGSLAGGVAHDFNNLLSVILSYSSLILDDLPPGAASRTDVEQIQKASHRATALTRQLLAFSRKQVLEPAVLDVNQIIAGIQTMLTRVLGEDVALSFVANAQNGRIYADGGQIEQVLMNLLVNAREAMPNGGTLAIETENVSGEELGLIAPCGYVSISVSDTGVGMDAATRERVFEPFFTTKDKSKGTGLGLATVYGIVQQSGGQITVQSEPGRGSTFKVFLPLTDRALTPPKRTTPSTSVRGSETILLVEDEEQVRITTRTILGRQGYQVLDAQNGDEALLLCEQFGSEIHLLLSDVVMPRMSGPQVAERVKQSRPDVKVLFVSGYTDHTIVHHGVLAEGVDFLAKPVMPETLLRKVREVLDTPPSRSTPPARST